MVQVAMGVFNGQLPLVIFGSRTDPTHVRFSLIQIRKCWSYVVIHHQTIFERASFWRLCVLDVF